DRGPAKIASYAGRGRLVTWVTISVTRVAWMLRRSIRRRRETYTPGSRATTHLVAAASDPENELAERQCASALEDALRDACAELDPRLRNVLWMHFANGLSIDDIGVAYGVHRATAARWIVRAQHRLSTATCDRLASRLQLSTVEVIRIARLLERRL